MELWRNRYWFKEENEMPCVKEQFLGIEINLRVSFRKKIDKWTQNDELTSISWFQLMKIEKDHIKVVVAQR